MRTIHGKLLFDNPQDIEILKNLTKRWSSACRYAYKRLLEGMGLNLLRKELMEKFKLNTRYSYSAIVKAQALVSSRKELNKSLRKIIFGGRALFEKLRKKHINGKKYEELKRKWREKREGNLYSIGQKHSKGNQNLRVEVREDGLFLRINVGNRQYIYGKVSAGKREKEIKAIAFSGKAYSVEINLENGSYYAKFTIEEEFPPIEITKAYGVIGVDLNAFPEHMAWAETDEYGKLISYGKINMPELNSGNSNKRECFAWHYAHEITDKAKEKGKAIVVEKLKMKDKGRRGDYSGRKSRRIRHNFAYRSLLEKIKLLARRKGIQVIEVNPAYTSIIGILKYAPLRMVTKDVAGAYVIARRGLGLKEKIPENYMELPKNLTIEELQELKEYVAKNVENKNIREARLREISNLIKSLESKTERVSEPLDGTSLGIRLNLWRVLKVVVLTALSPGASLRDVSILKGVIFPRDVPTLRGILFRVSGETQEGTVPVAEDRGVAYG